MWLFPDASPASHPPASWNTFPGAMEVTAAGLHFLGPGHGRQRGLLGEKGKPKPLIHWLHHVTSQTLWDLGFSGTCCILH